MNICLLGRYRVSMLLALVWIAAAGCSEDLSSPNASGGAGQGARWTPPTQGEAPQSPVSVDYSTGKVVSFADQRTYEVKPTELQYRLKPGSKFSYRVESSIKLPGKEKMMNGFLNYEVLTPSPDRIEKHVGAIEQTKSTGTAFAVHADGFLVTCAHVVEGAIEIKAKLDGRHYAAKVVDIDRKHDLALIRIDAPPLTPIPLIDSNEVQLAEEVRVVGFPLTDVLGDSLKISRGTVSGIDKEQADRVFQLDAGVNPGNSGGPVVTEKGHLAGVASSLLSGDGLSNVGFAVPANRVANMLDKQKLPYQKADTTEPYLRGPDLAKRITPSVALLNVTVGANGVGIADDGLLSFYGKLELFEKREGWSGIFKISDAEPVVDRGHLLIKPFGEVSFNNGEHFVPPFVAILSTAGLERLPDSDVEEWDFTDVRIVPQKKDSKFVIEEDEFAGFMKNDPYLGKHFRFGLRPKLKEVASYVYHPAIEHASYRISSRSGDEVEIKKTCELTTVHEDQRTPFYHLKGESTIVFDKKAGRVKSIQFDGTVDIAADGEIASLPVSYKCTLGSDYVPPDRTGQPKFDMNAPPSTEPLPKIDGLTKLDLSS
ncbi:hypothetical protein C5Y96_15740 [Blastopirellula marina]|uniref:Serine protease n=1 Tax=Blastopirellula marina TaxID=124 RepID=A0A2S8FAK1_9BACT|nr:MULTISPECIES: trypsin-like peptidase domain-containing protein [Pirellulaceae]PQO29198.1 hypothetical protein C5Y96_15740 [Blastopirellula marina]RCS50391.1 serine protease [Bremerella cremea]